VRYNVYIYIYMSLGAEGLNPILSTRSRCHLGITKCVTRFVSYLGIIKHVARLISDLGIIIFISRFICYLGVFKYVASFIPCLLCHISPASFTTKPFKFVHCYVRLCLADLTL
jgi:hypothetical protein